MLSVISTWKLFDLSKSSDLRPAAASPDSPGARRSSGRWWGPLCFSPGSLWTALSAGGEWSSGPHQPAGRPFPGPTRRAVRPDAPPFEPSPGGTEMKGGAGWVIQEVRVGDKKRLQRYTRKLRLLNQKKNIKAWKHFIHLNQYSNVTRSQLGTKEYFDGMVCRKCKDFPLQSKKIKEKNKIFLRKIMNACTIFLFLCVLD